MGWIKWTKNIAPKNKLHTLIISTVLLIVTGCSVSYSFNGSSIDYGKIKTISISDFPIRADYVYPPLAIAFNEELQSIFNRQTKLIQINKGGDLEIEGEIVAYRQINQAVKADGFASEVKLELEVNVRFTNNTKHEEDFERRYSANRLYDASQPLVNVQDQLITEMVKDISEQIFNATVANW